MNRGDLVDAFGASMNQASTELSWYASDNMNFDKSARTYARPAEFEPLFLKPDACPYLSQIRSVADPQDQQIVVLNGAEIVTKTLAQTSISQMVAEP